MIQTGLGFSSVKESRSTRRAAQKTKQIGNLIQFLESKTKSLSDIIGSLAYLVGEPVGRRRKGKEKQA